ncbi:hypothetical protein B2J96_04440 [Mycobacterium shigaense]|nr:hypothetical protein B2J96_04440 [Mycobacterium shigaense]
MNRDEIAAVTEQFGVATEQVERDHLISHLLGYLSRDFGDRIHFIGGTVIWSLPRGRRHVTLPGSVALFPTQRAGTGLPHTTGAQPRRAHRHPTPAQPGGTRSRTNAVAIRLREAGRRRRPPKLRRYSGYFCEIWDR